MQRTDSWYMSMRKPKSWLEWGSTMKGFFYGFSQFVYKGELIKASLFNLYTLDM